MASKSVTESKVSNDPRTRPLTSSLKKQSTLSPAKGVASVSSLSANTSNLGTGSGVLTTTEVSPELSLPPSSLNLRIYSPSTAGTNVSDTFPGKAGIISTE